MTNELMVQGTSAIDISYGSRDDVREVADRLMSLHPAAQKLGKPVMRTVAQLAIMTGANPLPTAQEIHVWDDWQGVHVALGIAYYRRKAAEKDTVMWCIGDSPRLMKPEEREAHGVPDGAIGAICRGYLMSKFIELIKAGLTTNQAQDALAREGVAVVTADNMYSEKKGKEISPPNGRTWAWVARKRCEKDFYSQMSLIDTMGHAVSQIIPVSPARDMPQISLDEFNEIAFDSQPVHDDRYEIGDDFIDSDFVEAHDDSNDDESITSEQYLQAAVSCVDLQGFARNMVSAGYFEKVPDVVDALTTAYADEHEKKFYFPTKDKNKRNDLMLWLVEYAGKQS